MRLGILSIIFVRVLASSTSAQQPSPPAPPIQGLTINYQPPAPPEDKCAPLNRQLNPDECDGLLSPVRNIRMAPGERRIFLFDRPFKTINVETKAGSLGLPAIM